MHVTLIILFSSYKLTIFLYQGTPIGLSFSIHQNFNAFISSQTIKNIIIKHSLG